MKDILRGCFSGARDAKVVAALKIVYLDYAALRLAGKTFLSGYQLLPNVFTFTHDINQLQVT
jgi:hypothetical protein